MGAGQKGSSNATDSRVGSDKLAWSSSTAHERNFARDMTSGQEWDSVDLLHMGSLHSGAEAAVAATGGWRNSCLLPGDLANGASRFRSSIG
jgi:hypothetical protein